MMRRETGFSLLELLYVMLIIGFVLAAGSEMFVGLLSGYKQQSKITETSIEGIIGLDMLRRDLESAGYGLPWQLSVSYNEATNAVAAAYNDATTDPPRAIISGESAGYVIGSDYLVVKAINVGRSDACTKWAYLNTSGTANSWSSANEDLISTDRVIVLSPGTPEMASRVLVDKGGVFSTTFGNLSGYESADDIRIVYGVAPDNEGKPLRMPFNRADYYISTTATLPGRCAQGTGVLVKAIVNPTDGSFDGTNVLQLLDCVADMQVSFKLDRNQDGNLTDANVLNDLLGTPLTAAQIRSQLKEVRVFILAHEGQSDKSFAYPSETILVGDSESLGRKFSLNTIANWKNYRWKVYSVVVKLNNLR